MGFKCSFLGHRFDEPGLVNEREERGDDVIDIKRRVMVCSICGERRVLAERKEIKKRTSSVEEHEEETDEQATATETAEQVATEATDEQATATETAEQAATEATDDSSQEDEDSEQEKEDASPEIDGIEAETSGFAGVDVVEDSPESTPEERRDNGVILSGNNTAGQASSGWSTGSNGRLEDSWHPATNTPSPHQEEQTTSSSITAATDDGEILASASTDEPTRATGRDASNGTPNQTTQKDEQPTEAKQNSSKFEDEMLSCSTCGFSVITANSPFRSGDICPQCHDTYLTDHASSCHHSTE